MKRLQLNIFNDIATKDVDKPILTNVEEFWDLYLRLIELKGNYALGNTEHRTLIFLMTNSEDINYFSLKMSVYLQKYLNVGYNRVYMLKNQLKDKGFLIEEDGDVRLHNSLLYTKRNFDKILKNGQEIEFKLPIQIQN